MKKGGGRVTATHAVEDLKGLRTSQDFEAALMIAPELGFPTGVDGLNARRKFFIDAVDGRQLG
jgi:hypothetical protein